MNRERRQGGQSHCSHFVDCPQSVSVSTTVFTRQTPPTLVAKCNVVGSLKCYLQILLLFSSLAIAINKFVSYNMRQFLENVCLFIKFDEYVGSLHVFCSKLNTHFINLEMNSQSSVKFPDI